MLRVFSAAAAILAATIAQGAILFQQPVETGIGGHLYVPTAAHSPPPVGQFALILWQPNPSTSDGLLVPTNWNASVETGLLASNALYELGFANKAGTSTAQMKGNAVGVYINSADLPNSPPSTKMMITPEYLFPPAEQIKPFASAAPLRVHFDLQVPVAEGNDTYVVADFLFTGPNGVRVSYGVKLFHNGGGVGAVGMGYDQDSNGYMFNVPLVTGNAFVTPSPTSSLGSGAPWTGWHHFDYSVSKPQFTAALAMLIKQFPAAGLSPDSTLYALAEWHLNAEFHFNPLPASLGWSMRALHILGGN